MGGETKGTVVDAVAAVLRAEGVEWLSCYPTTPLIDAAVRAGIRPVICRQERVGVGIADGFSRTARDGSFGVFAMQYGPGAENAFPGISSAYADGVPILLLPLGNALDRAQTRPLFRAADAFRPVTKHFETIARPEQVGPVMRRAMSALRNGPPGPVMVEMPDDVAGSDVVIPTHRPVVRAGTQAADADVDRALATVRDARRPIILAGAGILRAGAGAELLEFAEQLRLPVVTTLGGKSSFPESHPLALGTASLVMADHTLHALQDADAVLALGCSLTRHFLSARLPQDARIVQLTIDPRDLDKTYATDTALVGDARLVLRQLITAAASSGSDARPPMSEVTGPIASARDAWLGSWRAKRESDEVPITPYRALSVFMAATEPDETIVTHDSGSPRDQILPFYRAGVPGTYMGWGKSHALGSGVGLIMGAKLAAPDKFCVHFMGDAAFGMTGLDVETAVRERIPVAWVVFNNSHMAIEIGHLNESHDQYGARDIGGDYAAIAQALGAEARRVERVEDLDPAFTFARETTEAGRPVLLEIITAQETAFTNRGALVP